MPFGNTTAGAARDLGSAPNTLTQDVNAEGSGTTPDVWYKYTAVDNYVYGLFGLGDLTTYKPTITVYQNDGVTLYLQGIIGTNVPIQFPVVLGNTYRFKFHSSTGHVVAANLSVDILRAPQNALALGQILIPDAGDIDIFPASILDPTTGAVVSFVNPFPTAEQGSGSLPDGTIGAADDINNQYVLYDSSLNIINTISPEGDGIGSNNNNAFYVGSGNSVVTKYSNLGVLLQTWNLGAHGQPTTLATNPADTVLYVSFGTTNSLVKAWDLINSVFLTDFAAAISGCITPGDIIVLSNGNVVVPYQKNSPSADLTVKVYNSAGSVLVSKDYGSNVNNGTVRLCPALDDPNSFWLWIHTPGDGGSGQTLLKNVKASDLSDITPIGPLDVFEGGVYQSNPTATPVRFGASSSCPLMIMRAPAAPNIQITKSASGIFNQGGNGSYTITVSNTGGADNTGLVTVTEDIPSGLSLIGMSGSGWTCIGNVCTRSDTLDAGNSYPVINVQVNININATSPQINEVTANAASFSLSTPIVNVEGGIYYIHIGKTNDTLYYSNYFTQATNYYYYNAYSIVTMIPNPFFII